MIVKEKDLSKIIKNNFHLRTLLLELEGMIEGHISFIKAICIYIHKKGILNIFELFCCYYLLNHHRLLLIPNFYMIDI